jgi:hypothetical protein
MSWASMLRGLAGRWDGCEDEHLAYRIGRLMASVNVIVIANLCKINYSIQLIPQEELAHAPGRNTPLSPWWCPVEAS